MHISNRHLDLEPVLVSMAQKFSLSGILVDSPGEEVEVEMEDFLTDSLEEEPDFYLTTFELNSDATWVLLSRGSQIESLLSKPHTQKLDGPGLRRIWTDDFSNLFEVLGE